MDAAPQLEWKATFEGGRTLVCLCILSAAPDTETMLAAMLQHLCGSYKILKVKERRNPEGSFRAGRPLP